MRIKKLIRKLIRFLAAHRCLVLLNDKIYLKVVYWARTGKQLNLKNPITFNEKMQWLKLYNRNYKYSKLVDKYEVKKYVENIIGKEYIIHTIGVYDSFDKIDFDSLPNQFIIKCTHDSGGNYICKDKRKINIEDIRLKINKAMKSNYYKYGREWPYKDVKPRIIIEEYLSNNDKDLIDYKFWCFNGEPKICLVCTDRQTELKETFFDTNWNLLDLKRTNHKIDETIAKPTNLELMKELSNKLSQDMPFIRVDFYEVNGKVYFGELTFFPASGFSTFEPEEWDRKLGDWIPLT